jgi:hypothetical protein
MEMHFPINTIGYAFPLHPFPTISKELGNGVTDCFYGGFFGHFQFPLFPYSTSSNGDCIKTSPHTLNQSDFFCSSKGGTNETQNLELCRKVLCLAGNHPNHQN